MGQSSYQKLSHRINIKFINGDNNELLFEIKNQVWMDIGKFYTDTYVDDLIKQTIPSDKIPKNVVVMVAANFILK